MPSDDLTFVPTSSLLHEIQARMDCMVFVGSANRTTDEDSLLFVAGGSFHGCLGLLEAGRLLVLSKDTEDENTTN